MPNRPGPQRSDRHSAGVGHEGEFGLGTKCRVGGGRCWARYADTMNPRIVCTGCNNKMRTLADITTHDDVGEVFLCQVCGNQYGRESAGAALVLLPPKSTDLPSKA